ncbi:vam6/Vps39-like protein [Leguminivora glycinivorella]|uniref:vam6/Vps39-like protein n=1 Tax=Leguminivora glycinivorella TaxID=1035111 RepID=UPI00200F621F|nr:vam6/Vps39-like protein [Leguminivora glycinivorella]
MFHSKINKKRQAQMISLMQTLNDCSEEDRPQKVHSIKILTAQEFFDTKKYAQAINIFKQLNIEPTDVIKLIPELDNKPGKCGKIKGEDLRNAVRALVEYLKWKKKSVGEANGQDGQSVLELIDTTLLKCYVQLNDTKALIDLLRENNYQLEEAENILTLHERFSELVILYQTHGHHWKALQLLKEQAKHSDLSQMRHRMTIHYLQKMGTENLDIIFEFSDSILKEQPEEALKIFTEDKIEVKNLPRENILNFIKNNHKSLVVPYLEHIIHTWNENSALFHNELIIQYTERIMDKDADSQDLSHTKSKLLSFLQTSTHYTPESVIAHFPTDSLFEERAAILEKLGRHEQALAIYIHILGDINCAIQYCEKTHNIHDEDTRDIYIVLLQFLVNPQQGPVGAMAKLPRHPRTEKPDLEAVFSILEKHADKICPVKALSVLPDSLPLSRLNYYLQYAMDNQLAIKRSTQVLKGLLYAEQLQIEDLKEYYESKSILVSEFNVCRVCKKKFRNQNALMLYPNGTVVHYSCGLTK